MSERPNMSAVSARPWRLASEDPNLVVSDTQPWGLGCIWGTKADAAFIVYAANRIEEAERRLSSLIEYIDPSRKGQRSWVTAYVIATATVVPTPPAPFSLSAQDIRRVK